MQDNLVPRRGNRFSQLLGLLLLRLLRWRIVGTLPNIPKAVVIGAPHSSNWDGLVAAGVVLTLRVRIGLMAKDSLFRWPVAGLFRWLGGIPIDRHSGSGGVVAQSVARFQEREQLFLGVAPEGTRTAASQWRTGFWQIARQAGVPIIVVVLDYGRRELRIAETLQPGDDLDTDMQRILAHYRDAVPRRPERLSAPLAALQGQPPGKRETAPAPADPPFQKRE
ncbi:lysophospholipid acyltransferase family protein [Alcanivorax quisquiliarum]|uniref:Lysophospholipid acyltransferase family protein n=1 Tax=Alcanivorax quisquiliarum TaxID=2933565 RepID=A0ABT0E320_9GAMM|nr:lysophospholipid acyltransferase family protein [Alcanivorax quisquiliarum]MCK0536200.1 lysophospholipid acyltransferase family protein [Alcanivorax quisquiliarum]